MEPKWIFDRLYVVTRNVNKSYEIYEVDFVYSTINRVVTFETDLDDWHVIMSADPFHGFVFVDEYFTF